MEQARRWRTVDLRSKHIRWAADRIVLQSAQYSEDVYLTVRNLRVRVCSFRMLGILLQVSASMATRAPAVWTTSPHMPQSQRLPNICPHRTGTASTAGEGGPVEDLPPPAPKAESKKAKLQRLTKELQDELDEEKKQKEKAEEEKEDASKKEAEEDEDDEDDEGSHEMGGPQRK